MCRLCVDVRMRRCEDMNEKTVGNKMKHYDNDDYNENDSGNSHVQRNVSCKEQDLKSKIIYHAFFQS